MSKRLLILSLLTLSLLMAGLTANAGAHTIYWTNWTSQTYGIPGSALGTIALSGGTVAVGYTGEVRSVGDLGDYQGFTASYTKPGVVDNAPPNAPSGTAYTSVALLGNSTIVNTITFSQSVINPVMAIQSLGQPGDQAVYAFNQSFTLLANGPGHWGGDAPYQMWQSGNSLYGKGGNGIIQFSGVYNSISWTAGDGENYHMFTVGAPSAVPLPSALLLLGPGLAGLTAIRRRLRK